MHNIILLRYIVISSLLHGSKVNINNNDNDITQVECNITGLYVLYKGLYSKLKFSTCIPF